VRGRRLLINGSYVRALCFVLLTGLLAAVMVASLLLMGAAPRVVFMPGFIIKSWLEYLGFHVPNTVGVMSTVFFTGS